MTLDTRVAIIGSGFGGLGIAIRLKQQGHADFVVLERASDVGGAWRDNTYPGCACDVESHLYSFSFALEPTWSRRFSSQPEIWAYLRRCAERFGILPHVRFGHAVEDAQWDDAARRWRITTTGDAITAQHLVVACGAFSAPRFPDVPGVDRFDGPLFHSSGWRHDVDLAGKRIAVVGTGASAIQFIPEIQPRVARLTVFQRTAPWILPRPDRPIRAGWQRVYARVPGAQRVARSVVYLSREWSVVLFRHPAAGRLFEPIAARHLARQVPDAALRAALTPPYRMGCKRVLLSSTYYPALTQPNVSLITEGVAELRARSLVDTAGVEHPADAIICATGFAVTEPPIAARLRGRAGRTLASVWQGSPAAHVGTTVSGFPNLFLLLGPNTGLGHTSVVFMIEAQIAHVLGALEWARARHVERLEPRADAQAAYVAEIDRTMRGTVWMTGGCRSWYLDATGRNSTLWPGGSWRFARRVSRFRPEEYLAA